MDTLFGGIIPIFSEKFGFDYRHKSLMLKVFFEFSDYGDSDGKIKNIGFLIE